MAQCLVGESSGIDMLRREVRAVAATSSTVLITGETGTGKGLVARLLHDLSGASPFVHVDCAALSPSLIESELFGHERGAFTGASERRIGRFEQARGGTLFLDELAELHPGQRPTLMRHARKRMVSVAMSTEQVMGSPAASVTASIGRLRGLSWL